LIGLEWNDRRTVTRMEEGRARLTPAQERALMLWEAEREATDAFDLNDERVGAAA